MTRRALGLGVVAAAVYLVAAAVSFGRLVPARPLFDGGAPPQPYRWVAPPRDFAATNQPPESRTTTVPFTRSGLQTATVLTPDLQAAVVFPPNSVAPREGVDEIFVSVRPLDPARIGDPPEGLGYDGNAYEIAATYGEGDEAVEVTEDVVLSLRYPFNATEIYRRSGDGWTKLDLIDSQGVPFQLTADSAELGTFVPIGLPFHQPGDTRLFDILYAAGGLVVVIVGIWVGRGRRKEKARRQRLKAMGKKAKQPPREGPGAQGR